VSKYWQGKFPYSTNSLFAHTPNITHNNYQEHKIVHIVTLIESHSRTEKMKDEK
jgi:hypothetical protein